MEFFYWMLGIALVNLIIATFRHVSSEKMANELVYDLRANLYKHFMRQDLGWYDDRANTSSVLISTMAEQTEKVQ
jgi:ABC-type multidrug transport system fused ATPase/permease subunit